MGGRGQGVRRGRNDVRGKVNSGRYDKVTTGGATGNRWQILDQTGEDLDMSIDELRRERGEEIREDRMREEEERRDNGVAVRTESGF